MLAKLLSLHLSGWSDEIDLQACCLADEKAWTLTISKRCHSGAVGKEKEKRAPIKTKYMIKLLLSRKYVMLRCCFTDVTLLKQNKKLSASVESY